MCTLMKAVPSNGVRWCHSWLHGDDGDLHCSSTMLTEQLGSLSKHFRIWNQIDCVETTR